MGRLNRRIPNELRKRTAQSCDLCKTRRCKCVPSGEGKSCVSCLEQGVECKYTAPRKQRFYGSLDDLSDRYRCLEAIVKGAYPNDATATTTDLLQLGRRLGCVMPDLSPASRRDIKMELLVRDPDSHFQTAAPHPESPRGHDKQSPDVKRDDSAADDHGSAENETPSPAVFKDSSGNEHYIGPSGSLNFLHQLRQVFMSTQGPPTAFGHEVALQIPTLNTAKTLEPEDHGASGVAEFGDSQSAMTEWHEALALLPDAGVLDPLVNAYFQHTHEDFPLFQRQHFQDQYGFFLYDAGKSARHPRRTDYATPDWGWLACLYMILVFGSIAQPELPTAFTCLVQRRHVAASRVMLPQLIAKCSMNNLRALILLALYLHNSNERNASWNLTGTAIRMAFAIGLHRKIPDPPCPETESRSLVLSTLYSFELFLAANLGRPNGLSETDVESFPLPPAPGRDGGGTDPELISLTVGLNTILQRTRLMYCRRKASYGGNADTAHGGGVDDIQHRLERWREDLKQHPQFDIPTISLAGVTGYYFGSKGNEADYDRLRKSLTTQSPGHVRAVLMLHVQFHYIGIITTRHFLLHDIAAARLNTKSNAECMSTLAQSCVWHSHQLAYIFLLMDSFHLVNGRTGFDVFYGYWAGMLLNLMLLWPKNPKYAPPPGQPCPLRCLVQKVHDVVTRVEKSDTMQRLSNVMDAFVAWADSVEGGLASPVAPVLQQHRQPSGLSTPLNSLNSPEQPYQPHQQQQQSLALGPTSGISSNPGEVPISLASMPGWPSAHGQVGAPMVGMNMAFANLPQSENVATAFLSTFLAPDDQAAMLGLLDPDFTAQGFRTS